MIAVFCRQNLNMIHVSPEKQFIWIKDSKDVRGRKFTGIVRLFDWYEDEKIRQAYQLLIDRQPELQDER